MNNLHLLFDLDGTLVNTDHIYIDIWHAILNKYNILVTADYFNYFIKGNSDINFIRYLIPNLSKEEIQTISEEKDRLFIEKINYYDKEILLDGVLEFFKKNKDRKIGIVTSCNKLAAKFILKKTGLEKYIDVVIASEDCNKHKPDAEPYLNAIKYLNIKKEECIIFEDSYSGYCSAKNTGVHNICLILNEKSCNDIKNVNEFKINNYTNLNINDILEYEKINNHNTEKIVTNPKLLNYIYNALNKLPISNIIKTNNNLKTGYICDINSYLLTYNDNTTENIILKISNLDNELSNIAIELNMYKNESYFYSTLSPLITNINIPKFYGYFKYNNKDGIILENLCKYQGIFNINLNNNNIDLLLQIVSNIFKMHNRFYFESDNHIIHDMKNLQTVKEISYYKELINNKYNKFIKNNDILLTKKNKTHLQYIYNNFDNILNEASTFPLSFCHGDLKSANIFYKDNITPYFLDWQYTHLNKGISDIAFLLVESIDFDIIIVDIVIKYYYKLMTKHHKCSYEEFLKDFKNALCVFPFFVCIWFNCVDKNKLLDTIFPIKFMKNLLKYYDYYL